MSRRRYGGSGPPGRQRDARGLGRWAVAGSAVLAVLLGVSGPAVAVPPPPPNPSDSELDSSRQRADRHAGRVGELTSDLADAESRLQKLQAKVARKMEEANKALVDMRAAQDAADKAKREAEAAKRESAAAERTVAQAQKRVDRFVASSFRQGSTVGSISAYMNSSGPEDLLDRSEMLEAVGSDKLTGLESMKRARTDKANKDAAARRALEIAERKEAEAKRAKRAADQARAAAIEARKGQQSRAEQLRATKAEVEDKLAAARTRVGNLEAQRERFEQWQERKRREEAQQAQQAQAAQSPPPSNGGSAAAPPSGSAVETVISRAKAQLGVRYSWGGGNAYGPTKGIRDGGVGDAHGDYMYPGFDCSGLMIYAFAGVGISLPHYSGYQYTSGTQVPVSQMRRGDMLFWNDGGGIHHVALYLGNGQMIEAPYSGANVRITPVRYSGLAPYATRLL